MPVYCGFGPVAVIGPVLESGRGVGVDSDFLFFVHPADGRICRIFGIDVFSD